MTKNKTVIIRTGRECFSLCLCFQRNLILYLYDRTVLSHAFQISFLFQCLYGIDILGSGLRGTHTYRLVHESRKTTVFCDC